MKCIVTGGAGFIGSNLVEELLQQGNKVKIIDDLSNGDEKNITEFKKKIIFVRETLLADPQILAKHFKGYDVIFHEAAINSVTRSILNPKPTSDVNIEGTLNVLLAAKKAHVGKVVYASSSSVYGDTKVLPKVESMEPHPKNIYALSKFVGEQYCKFFSEYYGLNTVSLRYFNVFGPKQNAKSEYAAAIPKFIRLLLKGERPIVYGDGKQTRDFTYVKNVVHGNILAAKSNVTDGTVINIACNKNISINNLIQDLNTIIGTAITPLYKPNRKGDVRDSLADITLAKKLLGYTPQFDMETGLRETLAWIKSKKTKTLLQ